MLWEILDIVFSCFFIDLYIAMSLHFCLCSIIFSHFKALEVFLKTFLGQGANMVVNLAFNFRIARRLPRVSASQACLRISCKGQSAALQPQSRVGRLCATWSEELEQIRALSSRSRNTNILVPFFPKTYFDNRPCSSTYSEQSLQSFETRIPMYL